MSARWVECRFDKARRASARQVVIGKVLLGWICEPHLRSPRTEDRMAVVELLLKRAESDFLRAVTEVVLQILMEADVEGLIGCSDPHARHAARSVEPADPETAAGLLLPALP
jgi:hypothetical protein